MKVHKLEIMVIDFDDVGIEGVKDMIQDAGYPNDSINPTVIYSQSVEIGKWEDSNPLNQKATMVKEFNRLFSDKNVEIVDIGDLDTLHDIILSAIGHDLSIDMVVDYYQKIPLELKLDASYYGIDDTVVRDNIYKWLKQNENGH